MYVLAVLTKAQLAIERAALSVKPNPNGLPGLGALDKLIDGLAQLALLACLAGMLFGAAQWGIGSRSNNYSQTSDGKMKVLYGLIGAFVVGACAALANFFYTSGSAVK